MKNGVHATSIAFAVCVCFVLPSCNEHVVQFEKPQPDGVANIIAFPANMQGHYITKDFGEEITLNDKTVVRRVVANFAEHKDSLYNYFTIEGDSVIDKEKHKKYKAAIKNDSVFWYYQSEPDTLFMIAENNIARRFKGHYFLNIKSEDGSWSVTKLSVKQGKLNFGFIADSTAIHHLKEITGEVQQDSVYTFNLTKKQFKKFNKNEGFRNSETYYKVK